jgi:membrane protein implicated in regulation of membrane protease activity
MVVAWIVIGMVLLLVELRHLAFYALFAAAGAFAAAIVAAFLPDVILLQLVVGVAVGGLGIWLLRPRISAAVHDSIGSHPGRGVHGTLVGEEVLTLDQVGDTHQLGHVRLAGERWLAVSGSGIPIPADRRVLVTGVQGTTLVVWPVDGTFEVGLDRRRDDELHDQGGEREEEP